MSEARFVGTVVAIEGAEVIGEVLAGRLRLALLVALSAGLLGTGVALGVFAALG